MPTEISTSAGLQSAERVAEEIAGPVIDGAAVDERPSDEAVSAGQSGESSEQPDVSAEDVSSLNLHKIDKVVLHNFQSWTKDSGPLEFKRDVLNMIRARNETGKSVIFKVFKQMCWPGKGGSAARLDLLRRNTSKAQADIYLSDGHIVRFVITKPDPYKQLTTQKYILETPDGKSTTFGGSFLPEPIRKVLGWYVDPNTEILLNLIEKDGLQLFINTSPQFNANALKFLTENPQVTEALEVITHWLKLCKESKSKLVRLQDYLTGRLAGLKYTDVATLMIENQKIQEILPVWSEVSPAVIALDVCENVLSKEPVKPACDFETADRMFSIWEVSDACLTGLEEVESVRHLEPVKPCVNWELADQVQSFIEVLNDLDDSVARVASVWASQPEEVSDIDAARCEALIPILQSLGQVSLTSDKLDAVFANRPEVPGVAQGLRKAKSVVPVIREVSEVSKSFVKLVELYNSRPIEPKDLRPAEQVFEIQESVSKCYKDLRTCFDVYRNMVVTAQQLKASEVALAEALGDLKECPVCGAPMNREGA